MANLQVKDGAAASKYLKSSGAGTDPDPHIPEHLETNSAAIKAAVELIDNAIAGNEMQVDVITSALPTGAATAANQTTGNASLASLETKIGEVQASPTANTLLDRLKQIYTVLTGTLTVAVGSALPAGANAIGKLAANSGVDIGDVDITSIAAGTNNIGDVDIAPKTLLYASGSASSSGDNSLIVAPGAGAIYISTLFIQNTTTTATTALIKNGATEIGRMLNQNQGDGLRLQFPAGREMKLSATTALNLNLSGANAHNYFVTYFVE